MTLLNDPRDEYFQHFGVKGMKWGVRKAVYNRQKKLASINRRDAANLRKTVRDIETGKTPKQKSTAQQLRDAADEFEGLDTNKANRFRKVAKDIESGKRLSEKSMTEIQLFKEAAKGLSSEAKRWEKAAADNKVKMDKLREEMDRPLTSKERQARNSKIVVGAFVIGAGIAMATTIMPALGSTKSQATPDIVNDFFAKVKV